MDYILKSRGRGKTYDLIKRSARTGERILCHTMGHERVISEKAKEMGLEIPKPIFYQHYDARRFSGEKVLLDEAGSIFRQLFNCEIAAITDTPDHVVLDTIDLSDDPDCYKKYYKN